jgi:zinc protease
MRRWISLALLLSTAALAKPAKPDLTMKMDDYFVQMRDFCFPSGLRVVLQEDHGNPLVSVHTVYEGGQRDDPAGKEGTAHLAEHLWFRSIHGDLDTGAALDGIGATWNAHTGLDQVGFETLAPAGALQTLLRLEALRMSEPFAGLGDAELGVEKGVVGGEQQLGGRPAFDLVRTHLAAALFPAGHPYARPAESPGSLDAISLSDVQAFAKAHWQPEEATVVVVGDFALEDAWKHLVSSFPKALLVDPAKPDSLDPGSCRPRMPKDKPEPPKPASTAIAKVQAPIARPMLAVAWTLPGGWRDGHADLEIAAEMLSAMTQYRVSAVDTSTGLANPASCALIPDVDASTLVCVAEVDEKRSPERALHFVELAAQDLRDPSGARLLAPWLEDAYNDERREIFESMEDVVSLEGGRGAALARHVHLTGSVTAARDRLTWLDKMTPERVSALFRTYVTAERMTTVVLEPAGAAVSSSESRLLSAPRGPRLDPGAADKTALAARVAMPKLGDAVEKKLDNGLTVIVIPHGGAPRVRTGLVLRGGEWSAPERGLDALTWELTDLFYEQGTFSLLDAPRPFLGAWGTQTDGYGKIVTLTGSSGNLDGQLYLLRDLVDHASADTSLKSRAIETAEAMDAWRSTNAETFARGEALRRLLPGVPSEEPTAADMKLVKAASVKSWHASVWQPGNATLLIVGKADPVEAVALAQAWFGDWSGGAEPRPTLPAPAAATPAPRQVVFVPATGTGTASMTLRCVVPGGEGARVLASAVESDSWEHLRERHGLVYGVDASVAEVGGHTVLALSTDTSPEASGPVLSSWFGLLEATGKSVEDAAVRHAKLDVARQVGLSLATPDGLFLSLARRVQRDQVPGGLARVPDRLSLVTSDDVRKGATACSGHEVVTVVGPATVEASLTAAGIAFER